MTNILLAGGYGRVAITALIKVVLLCNRYVNFPTHGDLLKVGFPAAGHAEIIRRPHGFV
jgi:hypothetical protein